MACKVKVNRHGYLAFRLYWDGNESWEGTEWKDTPKTRMKAEARALLISEQIDNGTFDYLKWFPNGNKADQFQPKSTKPIQSKPQSVRQFFGEWIEKKKPPFVRKSLERDYRQAFNKNILPFMGEMELNGVMVDTLEISVFTLWKGAS